MIKLINIGKAARLTNSKKKVITLRNIIKFNLNLNLSLNKQYIL
jgi:hypothetical protein